LAELLGHDGDNGALNCELADAITNGYISLDEDQLVARLRTTLRDALAIDSPKWAIAKQSAPRSQQPAR
jgi:hypothetical protein